MLKQKIMVSALMISFSLLTACAQQEPQNNQEENMNEASQKVTTKNKSAHPFGGWYCPDNLRGFPPVNIADLASVPVVNGRMPTKEETQNGTSLMYFDPWEYPTAKPVNMTMPRLARYFSKNTKQLELVIVIQAVVIDADTVVGFRYVDGGNGTAWFNEVTFLSDQEISAAGATPFVFLEAEINAPKEDVWNAIIKTAYAKNLGKRFGKKAFFDNEWKNNSKVDLAYNIVGESANGIVMLLYGNIYLQIDYDYNGRQAIEKILILDDEDGKSSKIQMVFGPYAKDVESQQKAWEKWLADVKNASEAKKQ